MQKDQLPSTGHSPRPAARSGWFQLGASVDMQVDAPILQDD